MLSCNYILFGEFAVYNQIVDSNRSTEKKEKSIEEKNFARAAKVFCGHINLTDLIGHIGRTREAQRKKSL